MGYRDCAYDFDPLFDEQTKKQLDKINELNEKIDEKIEELEEPKKRKCMQCHAGAIDIANFCGRCGEKLNAV